MPKPWHKLVISLEPSELELLATEARRVRLPVDIYVKHAALSAAENAVATSPYTPQKLIAIHSAAANRGHVWTEEELRQKRLPLYWSRDWLLAQLSHGKTYTDIAIRMVKGTKLDPATASDLPKLSPGQNTERTWL